MKIEQQQDIHWRIDLIEFQPNWIGIRFGFGLRIKSTVIKSKMVKEISKVINGKFNG